MESSKKMLSWFLVFFFFGVVLLFVQFQFVGFVLFCFLVVLFPPTSNGLLLPYYESEKGNFTNDWWILPGLLCLNCDRTLILIKKAHINFPL